MSEVLEGNSLEKSISFFRLSTGEDIISEYTCETSYIDKQSKIYTLFNPYKLINRRQLNNLLAIALLPWLPDELLANFDNTVSVQLKEKDIIVMSPLKEKMEEFYIKFVNKNIDTITETTKLIDKNLDDLIKNLYNDSNGDDIITK